ncbi:spike glycoprotein [Sesbania bispinosa]|nr:spike glycoprotein [Sesbania bispinosa]
MVHTVKVHTESRINRSRSTYTGSWFTQRRSADGEASSADAEEGTQRRGRR